MRRRTWPTVLLAGFLALSSSTLSAQERWVYRHNGPADGWDGSYSIAAGPDGNLYVAGWSAGSGTGEDLTVVSLTPSGARRWVYTYNGPGNGDDWAWSITAGPDGNLYAAGYSEGSGTCEDFVVVSLEPSGAERWVYRYNGPGNDWDIASSITAGPDGNLYAAGYSEGSGTGEDFVVVSLKPAGTERWVCRYNGPGNGDDWAYSIAAGPDGNLYVSGRSAGVGTERDFCVVSVSPSGAERWVYRYDRPGGDWDEAYSITAGPDGNLYAAGYSEGNGTGEDFTLVSVSPSGAERWVYRYNGPGNDRDFASSITAGPHGNLYAAGCSWGSGTGGDFCVVSLSPSGRERWVYRYNGPGNGLDCGWSVTAGPDGNLYAAGCSWGSETGDDFCVVSLSPSGRERWVYRYNGLGNDCDMAYSIIAVPDGNLYVAGWSWGGATDFDLAVMSLMGEAAGPQEAATGGGWIPADGSGKKDFGFNVHSEEGKVWGEFQFDDHDKRVNVHSEAFDDLAVYGDSAASFTGTCRVNRKTGYSLTCVVEDRGEPGIGRDRFSVKILGPDGDLYYSAGDLLGGGDIQIHSAAPRQGGRVRSFNHVQNGSEEPVLSLEEMDFSQPYPNPFSESTSLAYATVRFQEASLEIFDVTGKLVRRVFEAAQAPGKHSFKWDGTDSQGRKLSSGIYVYRLRVGDLFETGKIVMVR